MASNPTSSAAVVESSPSILPNNMSLRKLIPPKDCLKLQKRLQQRQPQQPMKHPSTTTNKAKAEKGTTQVEEEEEECCWSAVIARAKSHPHEAAESYFGLPTTDITTTSSSSSSATTPTNYNDRTTNTATNNNDIMHDIINYQPLHAMLKYNPPLNAVEAVLRAHPLAILSRTFEGTALQIAAEHSRVESGLVVLRLLLVAEMAMRRKEMLARVVDRVENGGREDLQKSQGQEQQQTLSSSSSSSSSSSFVKDTSTSIMVDTTRTETKDTSEEMKDIADEEEDTVLPQTTAISTKPTTKTTATRTTIFPTSSSSLTKSVVTFAATTKPSQPLLQPTQPQPHPQPQYQPQSETQSAYQTTLMHTTTLGPNPIAFLTNHRVPVKTAAMLLKWYPIGAFQLTTSGSSSDNNSDVVVGDYDMESGDGRVDDEYDGGSCSSPLIEIVDDFARDHYYDEDRDEEEYEEEDDYYDSESDYEEQLEPVEACSEDAARATADEAASLTAASLGTQRQQQLQRRRYHRRKEQRWEKFLHILYATDLVLQSTKQSGRSSGTDAMDANDGADTTTNDTATTHAESQATVASRTKGSGAMNATSIATTNDAANVNDATADIEQQPRQQTSTTTTPFHPVHAWIRCLTHPNNNHSYNLRLRHIQPYGAFSILHEMGQRIPHEFTARDGGDGNRTAFQILAESKAEDCGLVCWEEVKDVVECLVDADYRSAFL